MKIFKAKWDIINFLFEAGFEVCTWFSKVETVVLFTPIPSEDTAKKQHLEQTIAQLRKLVPEEWKLVCIEADLLTVLKMAEYGRDATQADLEGTWPRELDPNGDEWKDSLWSIRCLAKSGGAQ